MTKKNRSRQSIETKIFNGLLIISCLIIAGFLIFSNIKISQKRKILETRIDSLKQEIENLEQRNEELKGGMSETQDNAYWEEKIREYGYQKPGETAVVIKKDQESNQATTAPKNIWEKFLTEIKGIF